MALGGERRSTTARRVATTTTCSRSSHRSCPTTSASIVTNSWGEPTFGSSIGGPSRRDRRRARQRLRVGLHAGRRAGDRLLLLLRRRRRRPRRPGGSSTRTTRPATPGSPPSAARRSRSTTGQPRLRDRLGHRALQPRGERQGLGPARQFLYGAGGGYSQVFERPCSQDGIVTNNPTVGHSSRYGINQPRRRASHKTRLAPHRISMPRIHIHSDYSTHHSL